MSYAVFISRRGAWVLHKTFRSLTDARLEQSYQRSAYGIQARVFKSH